MTRVWIVVAGLGAMACAGDCPVQDEVPYDGVDQDCDGQDLVDVDRDGFTGVEAGGNDCDDADAGINPYAMELPYDDVDQDCSGADLVDVDGDGHDGLQAGGDDCDDEDPNAHPGAEDIAGDDEDQNCDGVDGVDADGDGHAGFDSGGNDCDDLDDTVHPGAVEVWYDDVDQDCDAACDHDQDGDGFVLDGHVPVDGDGCDLNPTKGKVRYLSDCNDTDDAARDNFLLSTDPADEAMGVLPDSAVSVSLVGVEASATLVLSDGTDDVLGGAKWFGPELIFTPAKALALGQTYTATVEWSCGPASWTFTTASTLP